MRTEDEHLASKQKLREVLRVMIETSKPLTVSALCERAKISRTSIYKLHGDVLCELRRARDQQRGDYDASRPQVGDSESCSNRLKEENERLVKQIEAVVSLLDHYYCAWKEANELLGRRDRELAQLRRSIERSPSLLKR